MKSLEQQSRSLMEGLELNEKTKWKVGDGKPRGGSSIENVRFWDLSKAELQYIIKDAGEAIKANPKGKKASSGKGNYADQVNDAQTVLGWRKKNGIKEGYTTPSLEQQSKMLLEGVNSPEAKWEKDPGPNNVGGFQLYIKKGSSWSSVGFIKKKDKPKKGFNGKLDMYDGSKTIKVDFSKFSVNN